MPRLSLFDLNSRHCQVEGESDLKANDCSARTSAPKELTEARHSSAMQKSSHSKTFKRSIVLFLHFFHYLKHYPNVSEKHDVSIQVSPKIKILLVVIRNLRVKALCVSLHICCFTACSLEAGRESSQMEKDAG